jgi:hypothetical protein
MALQATLNHPPRTGPQVATQKAIQARRTPTSAVIEEPEARSLPGGKSRWLIPAAGITSSVSRRAW